MLYIIYLTQYVFFLHGIFLGQWPSLTAIRRTYAINSQHFLCTKNIDDRFTKVPNIVYF